jgi:hypothetical protein
MILIGMRARGIHAMSNYEKKKGGGFKRLLANVGAVLAGLYLANFGWGFVDLIPDNFPGIGNLDEVLVSFILFVCLEAMGIGPEKFLKRGFKKSSQKEDKATQAKAAEVVNED